MKIINPYVELEDHGKRAGPAYSMHRAWVEITREAAVTPIPRTVALDMATMAKKPFAVAWLGHAAMLVRAGPQWILVDPMFANTAGPAAYLGPTRLAPLPILPADLPHIDLVLITHDHYDHLDKAEVRALASQPNGPPRFFVGEGLKAWFSANVDIDAEEFCWYQSRTIGSTEAIFVEAQHSSGRTPWGKNSTRWGGWVIRHGGATFYFAGDTAYVPALFAEIHRRIGHIDLAAIPIGAYLPRDLMRFEHMDPREALKAHLALGATQSFGVHWGTFQLGDEQPLEAARELLEAGRERGVGNFGLSPIGAIIDVLQTAPPMGGHLSPPLEQSLPVADC